LVKNRLNLSLIHFNQISFKKSIQLENNINLFGLSQLHYLSIYGVSNLIDLFTRNT